MRKKRKPFEKLCEYKDCINEVYAKGLCWNHYNQQRNGRLKEWGQVQRAYLLNTDVVFNDCFDELEREDIRCRVARILRKLPKRERKIIMYKLGFVRGEFTTFKKIASKYGVTAVRIRQLYLRALVKAREQQRREEYGKSTN